MIVSVFLKHKLFVKLYVFFKFSDFNVSYFSVFPGKVRLIPAETLDKELLKRFQGSLGGLNIDTNTSKIL